MIYFVQVLANFNSYQKIEPHLFVSCTCQWLQTNTKFYQPFYVTFCTGTRIMKRAPNTTLLLLENPEDGTATIR